MCSRRDCRRIKSYAITATSQHSSFTGNKHKPEVQRRFWIALSVVIPGFTLRLCGDFLSSIAYVFCSNALATLWQHYVASHSYMPLQITYGIRVEGNAQAPRGDGTDGGCVGSGKWNLLHKLLVSCPTLFHTFVSARSHFLLCVLICECFLAPPLHIGRQMHDGCA